MIPTRGRGLMRASRPPTRSGRYLELGLACAGDDDSEALVLLLASQGYWEFGFGIDAADDGGERARARPGARGISRGDSGVPTSS